MSDFQFTIYEEARIEERKLEKKNASKKGKKAKKGEEIDNKKIKIKSLDDVKSRKKKE